MPAGHCRVPFRVKVAVSEGPDERKPDWPAVSGGSCCLIELASVYRSVRGAPLCAAKGLCAGKRSRKSFPRSWKGATAREGAPLRKADEPCQALRSWTSVQGSTSTRPEGG